MEEKTKRKEKPKNYSRRFLGVTVFMALLMLVSVSVEVSFFWFRPCFECENLGYLSDETLQQIETQNSINVTQISASATQAAIATNQHEATEGYLQETATPSRAPAEHSP